MPRKRLTNKHLPQRVYWKKGAYRLLTKEGKWIKLGVSLPEMYKTLSEILDTDYKLHKFAEVITRYLNEVSPTKSAATYKREVPRTHYLRVFFGEMKTEDITSVDVYRYLDIRGEKGKTSANREFALLSDIFNYAVRWGVVPFNPCRGVKKFSEKRRARNITDAEFNAVLSIAEYPFNYAMQLTYFMALRPTEVIHLKKSGILADGFLIEITKTKFFTSNKLVTWNSSLKPLVDGLLENQARMARQSDYLLVTRQGEPYTYDGFSSIWQRLIAKAIKTQLIEKKFQFRDIRHKAATDMERKHGREAARQLLGHTTQNTTAKYIDGINMVIGNE